jgi:hypothetical protein
MDPFGSFKDDDDPSVDDKVEEDTATFWLLLDFGAEPAMTEEEDLPLTLEEDFALPLLLLDFGSEPGMTEEEDSSSSFKATLLLSSPHAARRIMDPIATAWLQGDNFAIVILEGRSPDRIQNNVFFIQVPCLRTMP